LNVVPGNGKPLGDGLPNLNQGPYKTFENRIAKLAAGPRKTVEVRIRPQYNASNLTSRPDEAELAFSPEVKKLFREMNDEIQRGEGERWGTCDLVADRTGEFKYRFSHDPPNRINGVFDDDSMGRFDRYLETYKAERGRA
jgi:DNA/RNA non-specific endonuclease